MHPLDSISDKLDRAKGQLSDLYSDLLAALDPDRHPVIAEIETYPYAKPVGATDQRSWTAFTVCVTNAPTFSNDIGMRLGEVIHNFRGSLDHLAWFLVPESHKKQLSARKKRNIAFPMVRSRQNYWGRINDLLPGVPNNLLKIIERYQPYRRSTAGRAMRNLRNLSDTDKHRTILPLVTLPQAGNLNIKYEGAELVGTFVHLKFGREVKKGTKILTLILAGGEVGKREVSLEGVITSQPIFCRSLLEPPSGTVAVAVEVALNDIRDACEHILSEVKANL
jgi:hypothetical protein